MELLKEERTYTGSIMNLEEQKKHIVGSSSATKPSSINMTKFGWTGHALKWTWLFEGKINRKPDKIIIYRNWSKKIWYHWLGNSTIVINKYRMEITLRSRKHAQTERSSGVIRMIYANWGKADKIAREFSQFAQIAIKPIESDHPADIQHAHLVMTTKALNPILKPMSEVKDSVGLLFDNSHPNLPEFTGEKSVEGAQGAEWFFTKFPAIVQYQVEMDKRYAQNIEKHLAVLESMDKGIKELTEAVKKSKEAKP